MSVEQLRFLARRVLRAHGAPEAGACWREFLYGGWRLLDCFDHEGRRYVIAQRSDGATLLPEERELLLRRARGEPLRVLAADLDVSVSAVSRRLASAMARLGVRSPAELVRLISGSACGQDGFGAP